MAKKTAWQYVEKAGRARPGKPTGRAGAARVFCGRIETAIFSGGFDTPRQITGATQPPSMPFFHTLIGHKGLVNQRRLFHEFCVLGGE
jgi:hypothetical protein